MTGWNLLDAVFPTGLLLLGVLGPVLWIIALIAAAAVIVAVVLVQNARKKRERELLRRAAQQPQPEKEGKHP